MASVMDETEVRTLPNGKKARVFKYWTDKQAMDELEKRAHPQTALSTEPRPEVEVRAPEPGERKDAPGGIFSQLKQGGMEGLAAITGALVPGVSGDEILASMKGQRPSLGGQVLPNELPPTDILGQTARFTGQQLPSVGIAGALGVGAKLAGRGPMALQSLGESMTTKPLSTIAKEVGYSAASGYGQAVGSKYGPRGELIGSVAGLGAPMTATLLKDTLVKGAFRGYGENFAEYQAKQAAFAKADVKPPTVGVLSDKVRGLESAMESVPGSFKFFHNAAVETQEKIASNLKGISQQLSKNDSPLAAGLDIQSGVKTWLADFRTEAARRYDVLDQLVPKSTMIEPKETLSLAANQMEMIKKTTYERVKKKWGYESKTTERTAFSPKVIKDAEETSKVIGERVTGDTWLQDLFKGLQQDAAKNGGKIPYEALKSARTQVGDALTSAEFIGNADKPRAFYKQVYGSLTQDIEQAIRGQGPEAKHAFELASGYWKRNIEQSDNLAEALANRQITPEKLYTWAIADANVGPSRIAAVRRSLTPDQFNTVRSATLNRMGAPDVSAPDDFGRDFSFVRFVRNYDKMTPEARRALFAGYRVELKGAKIDLKTALDDIARVSTMLEKSQGVMANPSGTAGKGLNAAVLFSVFTGAATGAMALGGASKASGQSDTTSGAAGAVGAILGGRFLSGSVSKRLLTNPQFITWLGESTRIAPKRIPGHLARLTEISTDPATQEAVMEYLDAVKQENQNDVIRTLYGRQ